MQQRAIPPRSRGVSRPSLRVSERRLRVGVLLALWAAAETHRALDDGTGVLPFDRGLVLLASSHPLGSALG